jgi:hypothetical protein
VAASKQAKLTARIILPPELRPGDVLLTTADLQPRQITAVRHSRFPSTAAYAIDREILILEVNDGCRRPIEVHCMALPILVRRSS